MLHSSSIDVGLSSAIPVPHFLRRNTDSSDAVLTAAKLQSPADFSQMTLTDEAISNDTQSRVDIAFGSLPKAPLSSYTNRGFNDVEFCPAISAFEIDAVRWPKVCQQLLAECGMQFSKLADDMRQEAAEGRKVLAISGLGRNEGRTTLTLCLAKQLAQSRIRVAIVDADFASPGVAGNLGINAEAGWEAVLQGDQTIWETMIDVASDHLSIVPLAAAHYAEPLRRPVYGIAAVLAELAEHFDVVLVDAGPLGEGDTADWLLDPTASVQGVILANDVRKNDASRLATACLQLAEAGVRQLGIAEMFGQQTAVDVK
ncbi:MAG: hypothetical protein IT427_05525 [Pirellulales bacterium]|nr:hypothetical protein [Pirellulales bacterium]